jgi:hypothetical protein
MIKNCIKAVTQVRNAIVAMEYAGDVSSTEAFGQAHNALQNAIDLTLVQMNISTK